MAEGDIELIITLADGEVVKGLARAEAQAKKSGASVEKSMGEGFSKGFSILNRQLLGLATTFAAAFAGRKIIEAAAGQQAAIARVNQSMISAGTYSAAASESMVKLADNIQKTTTVSDDAALGALALSKNYTKTNEQAQALTKAALDLSSATGDTLESAVDKLGKTYSGTADRLGKLIPELQTLTEEQLRSGAAIDIVARKFKGFAESEVNTFAGAMKQSANRFDDLLETLGGFVVNSPALTAAFKFISAQVQTLTAGLGGITGDPLKDILIGASDVARFFVSVLGPIVGFVVNEFILFGKTLGALGASIAQLMAGEFRAAATTFKDGVVKELFSIEKRFGDTGTNSALAIIDKFKTAIETAPPLEGPKVDGGGMGAGLTPDLTKSQQAFNTFLQQNAAFVVANKELFLTYADDISGITSGQLSQINDLSLSSSENLNAGLELAKQKTQDNLAAQAAKTTEIFSQISAGVNQFVQGSLTRLGTALVGAGGGFKGFAKAAGGILGDFFIKMGMTIITADAAIVALKASLSAFPGGFGIAAGIGLVIAGAALKGLAGGGASVPEAPSGGGGISGGGASAGESPVTAGVQEIEKRGPEVYVNVEGNIMDRRQTGLELADVIREAFDGNAVVFS